MIEHTIVILWEARGQPTHPSKKPISSIRPATLNWEPSEDIC